MADGFLSPEGLFYEKREAYHAETARRVLGGDMNHPDPVRELIARGFIAFIEFRAPDGKVSLQPDLDYVLGKRDGSVTTYQMQWIRKHMDEISQHQQYTINMAREGIFADVHISGVQMYHGCKNCENEKERKEWCLGRTASEPEACSCCQYTEAEPAGRIGKTAIVGMGALGLLYGTQIYDHRGADGVVYVMDEARVQKYQDRTFYKNGKAYQLPICSGQDMTPVDLVIIAVKYHALESALETMKNCVGEHTVIMSVMNGITTEQVIGERFGMDHMIDTVAQGMDAMKFDDELTFTRMGELRIGTRDSKRDGLVHQVAEYFDEIQMPYTEDVDIMRRMWSKFMLNVGVNQTCMVYETNYHGCLVSGEANRTLIAAMREVIALANAEGIDLCEKDLNEYIDILKTLSPEGMPSMRQDGVAHRRSEVEMFAGTVIRLAGKSGIYVPANEFLYERVKAIEAKY
ncbi:MAG: ketopantoate reductase family protein [Lachnospiraceae bacterium]|nr:ketopantoate reductase family protein [Lachnospiraceae bacterium]